MARSPSSPACISGLGITFKTMLEAGSAVTVQYPHEKEDPPPRARGVIALKEENCTVCMLCARECPDWCIYIEGHKEKRPPRREGGQPAHGQRPRPLRHRLRPLHVLRHLRRGVPVRRALLEPRVRVLRVEHRRPAPRQDASSASGWRRSPSPSRSRSARSRRSRDRSRRGRAEHRLLDPAAAAWLVAAIGRRAPQERRARRALPGRRARRRGRRSSSCWPPSSSPGCRCSSTSAPSSSCSSSASCSPGRRSAREASSTTTSAGSAAVVVGSSCSGWSPRCSSTPSAPRRSSFGDDPAHRPPVADSHVPRLPRALRGRLDAPARRAGRRRR